MKAVICEAYGGPEVLKIKEVEKPSPKANEVLVKIKAFGVTSGDVRIRSSKFPPGFTIPGRLALGITAPRKKILGSEFSGVVEAIGSTVTEFKPGDEVIGYRVFDVYAEYTCIKESAAVVIKPKTLSFEEAASIPFGATTALHFLGKTNINSGETILINGASGAVGSAAVQIANSLGAKVTAVCSAKNSDFVKLLGADEVIDYTKVDLKTIMAKFDVVFDTVGNLSFNEYKHLLESNGSFLQAVAGLAELLAKSQREEGKKFITSTAPEKKQDLLAIKKLVEQGKLKPTIDKVYELTDISKAHAYVETGRKRGSVVVKI